jgi:hypothetical protein
MSALGYSTEGGTMLGRAASYRAIAKTLNVWGVRTARGGTWQAATVRKIMLRAPRLAEAA